MKNLAQYFTSKKLYYIFLHIVLVVLAVQVVLLSRQNRTLKEGGEAPSHLEGIKAGDTLRLGQLERVSTGNGLDTTRAEQIIFVMTTSCPSCKLMIPIWNQFTTSHKDSFSVFAISLDGRDETEEYVKQNNPAYPVFRVIDAKAFKETNKIYFVPQTIIRENSGKVSKVWVGRLKEEEVREVETIASGKNHSK